MYPWMRGNLKFKGMGTLRMGSPCVVRVGSITNAIDTNPLQLVKGHHWEKQSNHNSITTIITRDAQMRAPRASRGI